TPAQNWISVGSSAAGFRDVYDLNGDGVFETTFVTPGSTALNQSLVIDLNNLHQPHADEWNAGYRTQLRRETTIDVSFRNRSFKDRVAYVERNAIYEAGVFKGYKNEALNNIFLVTSNQWNWADVRAVDMTVAKRGTRVQFIGSYSRQWRQLSGDWQPND